MCIPGRKEKRRRVHRSAKYYWLTFKQALYAKNNINTTINNNTRSAENHMKTIINIEIIQKKVQKSAFS